ncbi:hypothetical protein ABPG72_000075 [Tetrahymena utriculariae]
MSSLKKTKLQDPQKSEKQRNELRDINIHKQKLQSKYGEMHTEFVFYTKQSEQQTYFSNQVKNYKQLIDELKFQVHQKEEQLQCLVNQSVQLKKQSDEQNLYLVENSAAKNQQCLSQTNKSSHSSNFNLNMIDFKHKDGFQGNVSPSSIKFTNSDDGEVFKFKKIDKENISVAQIGNQNFHHCSQIQATNMKNKILQVELTLEEISEQILLEEQTQEYLNRMVQDTFKSTEKLKAENNRIEQQIHSFLIKEHKINNLKLSFKKDYDSVDKELKTAQTYVNKEIQYQQNKVQEKEILFQTQNKQIKESVKLIQKYRNQIQEQQKCKVSQLQKIENLEYERQQKEITKKDTELFLKNLGEIDLILKHFINGKPENLNWDQVDMAKQNFEYLFPPENTKNNESNIVNTSLQRISLRRPSINISALREQSSIDLQLDRQFSSTSSKFQQRDQNQKKSQYFIPIIDPQIAKVSQNQVVEKVNQFMKYHSLTPQQIQDKLISAYNQFIFQELTLKSRFSQLIEEREQLLTSIKNFNEKKDDLLKKAHQHQFLQKYEKKFQRIDQSAYEKYEDNTLNELFQKQENVKIHQVLVINQVQSEKFVAKIFYYLNELIFRWCSFINSSAQLGSNNYQQDNQAFIEQVKKNKEISKKIVNLIQNFQEASQKDIELEEEEEKQSAQNNEQKNKTKNDADQNPQEQIKEIERQEGGNLNKEQKIMLTLEKFQQEVKESDKIIISDIELENMYQIIKSDFILSNFMQETQLVEFLNKLVQEFKVESDPCSLNYFEEFYNCFINKIDDLKNESHKNFKLSMQFLTETLFTILQEVMDQIDKLNKKYQKQVETTINTPKNELNSSNILNRTNQSQSQQASPFKSQKSPLNETQKDQNTTANPFATSFMQKKLYRKRITMMKCREFNDYFGFETHKKLSNKAQTIIDVIYETIYDFKHGNQTDIFDQNQELNFFIEKRCQTKTFEKDIAQQSLEEQLKKDQEQKEKEKNNKTYFMKTKFFELSQKQNQEIAQIEKTYYKEIKKSSSLEKKKSAQMSEKQLSERRNKIIQQMKQTYSQFHTKYKPIPISLYQKDSDSTASENQINNTLNQKKKNEDSSKNPLIIPCQPVNQKINSELFNLSQIQSAEDRSANFNDQKKEKLSIFKTSQITKSQNASVNTSLNEILRFTEKEIPNQQKTSLDLNDNVSLKKIQKSMLLSNEKQQQLISINKRLENIRDKDDLNKSKNEKLSENSLKDAYIPIAITTTKYLIEENKNLNEKNISSNKKTKQNFKLDLNKLNNQENSKMTENFMSTKQMRKTNNYLRHSLDKLVKVPQPLAPKIISKPQTNRNSSQIKNSSINSQETSIYKLNPLNFYGFFTERQPLTNINNKYGIQNLSENSELSLSYQLSQNLRQTYLNCRQFKSINIGNHSQLNKIPDGLYNSNFFS